MEDALVADARQQDFSQVVEQDAWLGQQALTHGEVATAVTVLDVGEGGDGQCPQQRHG